MQLAVQKRNCKLQKERGQKMTGIDIIIGIVGLGFIAMLGIIVWHIFEDIL